MHIAIPKVSLLAALLIVGAAALSQGHQHGAMEMHGAAAKAPPVFVASTAKSFAALMVDAMAVMDDGMRRAVMNGDEEHDFAAMMIPHHQGAVDMAKALLLRSTDPAMRNLAQNIIAEQQIEIQLMQQWLKDHPAPALNSKTSKATP